LPIARRLRVHLSRIDLRFGLVLICFFLSGLAALIYQTAWTRQFAFVFGTSELAIATVLAAYMGGLAAGAAIAGKWVDRIRRPVATYGLLELAIALTALAVPLAIALATPLYTAVFGGVGALPDSGGLGHALFYLVCSFAILLIPTALMGATLPLLARYVVRRESEIGSRIGSLYAINTAGAVVGTVLAGFVLLPALGLRATTWVAAAANGLTFVVASFLARGALPATLAAPPAVAVGAAGSWILPVIAISGAVSFGYEVLWSRLLGHILGGSVYAFATMLGSFLLGIALGSGVASLFASSRGRAVRGFACAQVGTAVLSLLAFEAADWLPAISKALSTALASYAGARLYADAAVAGIAILPATFCIGATVPFAVRILARGEADAGAASARVLAWNTSGSIVGAIGAGFFLLPALGHNGLLALGVVVNLALAFAAASRFVSTRTLGAGAAIAIVGCGLFLPPEPPWNLLRASALVGRFGDGRVVHYGVGRSATILLEEEAGAWRLRSNGLPEARMARRGAYGGGSAFMRWFASVSSLARPEATRMLVVGLGGGGVLESVPSLIRSIDVVELEPEVVLANRVIAAERYRDPLSDPRVRLISNDARGALLLADERYDAIVSQPSHPWTAGASHLYTREFFELARQHLEPEGVLAQWMSLRFVDEPLLRSLVATLVEVFPHVRVYLPGSSGVLFLASVSPLSLEEDAPRAMAAAPDEFGDLGFFSVEDVAVALALDEEGARAFAAGAQLNTDDHNLLQTHSARLLRKRNPMLRFDDLVADDDPLLGPGLAELDRVVMARLLTLHGRLDRARRLAEHASDPAERAAMLGLIAAAEDNRAEARRQLETALEFDPEAEEARAALLQLRRGVLERAPDPAATLGLRLSPEERALLEGWRAAAAGDWRSVRRIDDALSGIRPPAPLAPDALRLRIGWRIALAESEGWMHETLALADRLIPITRKPEDLVLRARVTAHAGEARATVATLFEAASRMGPGGRSRKVAWEALGVLSALPEPASPNGQEGMDERLRLRTRLENLNRGKAP